MQSVVPRGMGRPRRIYGLEPGAYDEMLTAQGGRCAICGKDEVGGKGGRFHIDHDHDTGEMGGLLCHRCNIGIGMLKENADSLRNAIEYLNDPPARKRDSDPPRR